MPSNHPTPPTIWTIGHSTRTIETFIELLRENRIQLLADVRHYPASRRYPHFNKAQLADSLAVAGIRYEHLLDLGGRRTPRPDSHNLRWRNPQFRGYADYMETAPFHAGIAHLLQIASTAPTAIMCSEAVWWRCHRSMISDYLKSQRVQVFHIMDFHKTEEHPYTSAARIIDGRLSYEPDNSRSTMTEQLEDGLFTSETAETK